MPFENVTSAKWLDFVAQRAETLPNRSIADVLAGFQLVPGEPQDRVADATIHRGDLAIDGDFTPSSWITVVDGDLLVDGALSTQIEGGDGYTTLVVFGDLHCDSIDHDWASILLVTGDVVAREWVFASREDSAIAIGGSFRTPIFIGADIWISVGGAVEMEYGYGYAVDLAWSADAYGAPQIHPRRGWRELTLKLGLGQGHDEEQLLELLEARLYATGTLLRPA